MPRHGHRIATDGSNKENAVVSIDRQSTGRFPPSIRFRMRSCAIPIRTTRRCARRGLWCGSSIRHLGDGAASGSPRRADRLADLLFVGRGRLERFPQRAAVASAEHHPGSRSAAAYPNARGADAHPVAGRDQGSARDLRARSRIADRAAGRAARVRRHRRPGRSLSAESVSGCGGFPRTAART